jgi:DNA mismatch repair protein MutS
MMQQYLRIKEQHKDAVLFFRLGDFYEMFRNDAREVSRLLNLTLTQRNGIPMCGIPYHAAQNYIGRLLKAGKKIAICEQTVLPGKGQKLAEREVVEIITPGTVTDDNFLQDKSNNFLAAICESGMFLSFACADLSTAEFLVTSFPSKDKDLLKRELFRMAPREILVPESMAESDDYHFLFDNGCFVNRFPDWYFNSETAYKRLLIQFQTQNLKSFGIDRDDPEIITAGALLDYIADNSRSLVPHIRTIKKYSDNEFLGMDEATQKNLELVRNLQDGTISHTLLEVMDDTRTAAGGRRLKQWLLHPLVDVEAIEKRLDQVELLYRNQRLLTGIREILGSLLDLERLSTRVAMDKAHPKDLVALGRTLKNARLLSERAAAEGSPFFTGHDAMMAELDSLADKLLDALQDEPSLNVADGNIIREGHDAEIDQYRELQTHRENILDRYLDAVRTETGLTTLKIKYNRIIGYFFELSKAQAGSLPEGFIRRQSLVGGERYSTEKLAEIESDINNASEKLLQREKEVFIRIRDSVKPYISDILDCASLLSAIDCCQSFAWTATRNGFVRPVIGKGEEFRLDDSRHPVVEKNLPSGSFVPNSMEIDTGQKPVVLVTGPNMAGKSTLLRQMALITVLAQTGSFVPASSAAIGLVDRIFCRVGASDNLARGESTFLVEMNETAYILRNATPKSLIIMDEVGRGTGTDDGLALAWSILEYLIHKIGGRTLFATHYHELTRIDEIRIRNISMAVREEGKEILFLRKLTEGPASSSYGLHVAALAGIPREVLGRAEEVLAHLKANKNPGGEIGMVLSKPQFSQKELFDTGEPVMDEIKNIDINELTPLKALEKINQWQKFLKRGN